MDAGGESLLLRDAAEQAGQLVALFLGERGAEGVVMRLPGFGHLLHEPRSLVGHVKGIDLRPPVVEVRAVPLAQFLVRASPFFRLGRQALLLVDLQAPIGGELGGTAAALGLRARFGW